VCLHSVHCTRYTALVRSLIQAIPPPPPPPHSPPPYSPPPPPPRRLFLSQNGGKRCAALNSYDSCFVRECQKPVDCVVSDWVELTPCSRTCNEGVRTKMRVLMRQPSGGGKACPLWFHPDDQDAEDNIGDAHSQGAAGLGLESSGGVVRMTVKQKCILSQCVHDCRVGEWGHWSPCSQSCGSGKRQRSRSIVAAAEGKGGRACPSLTEYQSCVQPCELSVAMLAFEQSVRAGSFVCWSVEPWRCVALTPPLARPSPHLCSVLQLCHPRLHARPML
jgi:hypothetical protein